MAENPKGQAPSPRWSEREGHVQTLIAAALAAVEPAEAVRRHLSLAAGRLQVGAKSFALPENGRLFVVGAGKAGVAMGRAATDILGERLHRGLMAVPAPAPDDGPIEWIGAGHPLPTEGSLAAGHSLQRLLAQTRPHDLVLALISGGGSALLELPAEGLSLADLQTTTEALLRSGARIHEINVVRQQLSQIKGGGLAQMAAPAPVVALILSDVVGDHLEFIASGPTVAASGDRQQARRLAERYSLWGELPPAVRDHLSRPAVSQAGKPPEGHQVIVASNQMAAEAAARQASDLGFHARVLTTMLEGEAREVGALLAELARAVRLRSDPLPPPVCFLLGGETTVQVRGRGRGGRNQELALAAALRLEGCPRCLLATLATDGVDGPTPAAGAIVTGRTVADAMEQRLDLAAHLADNDSYGALSALGQTIETGPTGTNVNDLAFVLVY